MNIVRKISFLLTSRDRRDAYVLLAMMVVGMLLEMLGVGLVVPVIAMMLPANGYSTLSNLKPIFNFLDFAGGLSQAQLIIWGMLGLVVTYAVKNVFLAFLAWRQMRFVFGVQSKISARLFTTYLNQPYTFHLNRNSAQLINNVVNEVDLFTFNALLPGIALLTEGFVLFGIGCLLLAVEPLGTVIILLVLGGVAWCFNYYTRARIARWGEERQRHDVQKNKHLHQGLGGIKEVKLLGREGDFFELFRLHNLKSSRVRQYQATLQQFPRMWLELLAVVWLAIIVLSMLGQGREMASIVPTLGLFAAAAFRLMPSVSRVLGAWQSLRFGLPMVSTLYDEARLGTDEPQATGERQALPFQTEIRLAKISYTYPGAGTPSLSDISIVVNKGESIGFIGASGSGKSTLVDVMLGILTPYEGQVVVDGIDIRRNIRAWQSQIGYVPQSTYLTDDTLRSNVAFGLPQEQVDDAAVWRAIRAAQLEEYVSGLPEGLETIVGERGVRLSGGQRQRIGIARALYHDPGVLVLDEATSALDTATEEGVMQAVTALRNSKTLIIIAHRLSTVKNCDRLYQLEGGRVVATGSPSELIAKSP